MVDDRQVALTQQIMNLYQSQGVDRRHFLKMLAAVGGGTALSALLAACGGDDDDDDTDSSTGGDDAPAPTSNDSGADEASDDEADDEASDDGDTDETPAETSSGGATPKILIAGYNQDISNLDPHTGHDYSIATTQKSCYDTLLRYRGNPPQLVPLLATEYESNDDATEWTFKLDERAVFHDGTPVTASDVVYSVGRMIRKNRGVAWLFSNVMDEDGAEAVDDHTVVFKLHTPFAPLPMAMPWLFIANEKLVKEHEVDGDEGEGWLLDHEAGSGPFIIKSWNIGDSYEFEAVPDYWAGWPEGGRLAGYIWRIMRESSSRRLALLNGDIHTAGLSAEDFEAMQKEDGFELISQETLTVNSVKMNNKVGLMTDVNIRKAVSYAMDYDALLEIFNGQAVLMHGPLPPKNEYANLDMEVYRHDLDKAREHLAMSEYPDGGFELEYVYVTGLEWEEQIGLILLDQLSKLNISVKMQPLVWPDMVARMSKADTSPDLIAVQVTPDYPDPDAYLWGMYHSSQAGTYLAASHYNNPELDALLEQARETTDEATRRDLYNQAQQLIVDDAVEIWCHCSFSMRVNSAKMGGYEFCPIMGEYMADYWLED